MAFLIDLISKILPLDFFAILKLNLYFNSYFNDSASLYMTHLVEFHNRVMLYLVLIFVVICVFLFNLFTPLLLSFLSKRSLYVLIITNYYLLPVKSVIIYLINILLININIFLIKYIDVNPLYTTKIQK